MRQVIYWAYAAIATLAFTGSPVLAADYATCLLDKFPGVKNAPAPSPPS
jgi:hypothetical protein